MIVVEHGTVVDVPNDPVDGITIDTAGGGVEVTMTPLDDTLGEFEAVAGDPLAVAEGDGYETVAQPLADGDFRLAVTISGPESPHSFAYEMELPDGASALKRSDGGFDFVDAAGAVVGGLGAPWGEDAAGQPVAVTYDLVGNVLTRTVAISDAAAYPVLTNWCLFGKNPNGSCRGSSLAKEAAAAIAAGWLTRAVCLTGAIGFGAPTGGAGAVVVASLCTAAGFSVGNWAKNRV